MRRRTQSAAWAAIAIGAITIAVMASRRAAVSARPTHPARDYSNRSGLPLGIEASRGAARDAMREAKEYQTPSALKPFTAENETLRVASTK